MPDSLKTKSIGDLAEDQAANYLEERGYKVLQRNYRTRWCEIDIVASKGKRIYFVEVKYRRSVVWGEGLEYITPKKLKQMRFAAEFWASENNFAGDYSLSAVEVTGHDFKITNFIENCY